MITDEMLRRAASKSNEIYVNYFESTYNPELQHEFSLEFEKRIEKLKRKVRHPYFYSPLKRVASVILALAISISVWLAVDAKAREAFFGWIKEVYETYFVYRYTDNKKSDVSPAKYQLMGIPDGYTEVFVDDNENYYIAIYVDDSGEMLTFKYTNNPNETEWYVNASQMQKKQVYVNGYFADLLISTDPSVSNIILWTTSKNTAFYISAFLSENELIRLAKSVKEK